LGGIPIFGDLVMGVQGSEKVSGVILVGVAYGKVIHDQSELDVSGVMLPQAWGEWAGVVAMQE